MNASSQKPSYSLKNVKQLIRANNVLINQNAMVDAWNNFGWRPEDIKRCLLKLNDKYHSHNRERNHFHKTAPHHQFSDTTVDYYKAKNIMEKANVYTHFYIDPDSGMLIISSFKELS